MIENTGEMSFEFADDANIPVNIFINAPREGDNDKKETRWMMRADNFMPRRMCASEGSYRVFADTREELEDILQKHVLPLYEAAVAQIKGMMDGTQKCLYYWEKKDED